jgi:hypothetical protein
MTSPSSSRWCGELLALEEFNAAHALRKIAPHAFLRESRIFQRPPWLGQIYTLHVLDHPRRATVLASYGKRLLSKPYMGLKGRNIGSGVGVPVD